jgi:hypothetical protein
MTRISFAKSEKTLEDLSGSIESKPSTQITNRTVFGKIEKPSREIVEEITKMEPGPLNSLHS